MDLSSLSADFLVWAQSVSSYFGYLGIFFVNFVASTSIIFPIPAFVAVFTLGSVLNPWLVGLSSGLGCALGELTSYFIGRGSSKLIEKKYKKALEKGKKWFRNRRAFPFIVLFAATPLPDDVVGLLAGIFHYDIKKFLIASFIGKTILNTIIALAGFYGIRWFLTIFGG